MEQTKSTLAIDCDPTARRLRLRHRIARSLTLLALGACTIGASAALAAPASAAVSTVGLYTGGGNVSGFNSVGSWLGVHPGYVVDFLADSSWNTIEDPSWFVSQWSGSGADLSLSVPMLPASGATLASEASGAYNSNFRTLAQRLVSEGDPGIVLRLGWEFNGNWFPWSIQNGNASNYAAAWRQIVTTMRSVPGQAFKFDWTLNNGSSSDSSGLLNPQNAYPGDGYVDYVGMDVYDQSWASNPSSEANRFNGYVNQTYGMQWQRQFAAAHGKAVTFPEWGLDSGGSGFGGGDSPQFIQSMHSWFQGSNLAYESYFDFNAPDGDHLLSHYPNAQVAFKQDFGPGATAISPGPVSTPPPVTPKPKPKPKPKSHRSFRAHSARATARPTLKVSRTRSKTGSELIKLSWNSYGHAVAIFKNGRKVRTMRHYHSFVVRPRRHTATIELAVCELRSHVCSKAQHISLKRRPVAKAHAAIA